MVQFGSLTYREISKLANEGCLALVPTGCTEQQGLHLPVSFDSWLAENIACAAAEEAARNYGVNVLVLPTLPFGPTPEHRNFGSGYIDIPSDLHEAVVGHILASLADQGFRRMVVWRGCGGHNLRPAVDRFNQQYAGRARAFLPDLPYHAIWCRIGDPTSASAKLGAELWEAVVGNVARTLRDLAHA